MIEVMRSMAGGDIRLMESTLNPDDHDLSSLAPLISARHNKQCAHIYITLIAIIDSNGKPFIARI